MIVINIVIVLIILVVMMLLVNIYYLKVVHADSQENHILRGLKGKYDAIALGSAYCRYGIDFSETSVNGYNFGYASQFFYYTDIMLRYIAPKCLKNGGKVYLIIADLVFASVGKKELNYKGVMRFIPYCLLNKEHSLLEYMKVNYPAFFKVSVYKDSIKYFIKSLLGKVHLNNEFDTLTVNPLSEVEVEAAAQKRCEAWCKQFGLINTFSTDLPESIRRAFVETRMLLSSMIDYCNNNGYEPVLVVLPVSKNMKSKLGEEFLNRILFENIASANKNNARVVNCLDNNLFLNSDLYFRNADFLNARGRKECTKAIV